MRRYVLLIGCRAGTRIVAGSPRVKDCVRSLRGYGPRGHLRGLPGMRRTSDTSPASACPGHVGRVPGTPRSAASGIRTAWRALRNAAAPPARTPVGVSPPKPAPLRGCGAGSARRVRRYMCPQLGRRRPILPPARIARRRNDRTEMRGSRSRKRESLHHKEGMQRARGRSPRGTKDPSAVASGSTDYRWRWPDGHPQIHRRR
jgi:hypothetical protein